MEGESRIAKSMKTRREFSFAEIQFNFGNEEDIF